MARPFARMEIFRFSLYVTLPIFATYVYSDPQVMQQIITRLNYVIYPPEAERPPVGEEMEQYRQKKR
eukprot:CAMPEP_0118920272 /NCGR_PEP_ID=MMETSP1166-20130328/18984_1 /TAXON_ID=1104430 /ORGANISM="Chrysoreinhardia sp, Strain CCMP3193" /LENGTH=66 /DNA_ID=CAMNT_0006860809 /DNA_START=385 /DNA_END=585 /DNA_ORIENTATION=+